MDAQTIIARRVAAELRSGMLVNLGIGIPTLVANYVPADVKVFFQSENGLIGTGPIPEQGMEHPTLTDAGGRPITALPGACTFDSATSFALMQWTPFLMSTTCVTRQAASFRFTASETTFWKLSLQFLAAAQTP